MIRVVNGQPVEVPDDERITPEMKSARSHINDLLAWIQADGPEVRKLKQQFYEGRLSDAPGFDWYCDTTDAPKDT